MAKMTGGEAVVESLKAHEVDTVFGIISIHTLDLFDALLDNRENLRFIGGRHEHGCGFMADGYSRATGKPGVLLTSTGPGAADSVGALGEAYFSSSPVLEISTNVEQEFIDEGRLATHETKDQPGMLSSVTDWNPTIKQVESIPDHLVEAFQRFRTKRQRPIALEIPTDLLGQPAEVEVLRPRQTAPPAGDPTTVERALETLLRAKRPVIFVGEELQASEESQGVVRLAELLGAPVVSGDGAKGTFPEDHPLSLGPALGRRIWGDNPVQEWLGGCDVAVVLGSALTHRTTVGVGLKLPDTVIHVLLDPEIVGKNYPAAISIEADSGAVVRQWLEAIGDRDVYTGNAYKVEIEAIQKEIYQGLQAQWGNELRAFEAIREVAPRDTIFSLDPTIAANGASRCLPVYGARTYMHPHGWSGLGFAFPAGLGAKAGVPGSPVVCVTGDGGFQYNFQELATAAQYGIHAVVLMFNDNAWGVLKKYQQDRYGDDRLYATELVNPDFGKIFESYGFESAKVSSVEELTRALETAISGGRTYLVEAQIPDGIGAFR